jgi:TetR/AcrR family transcriptional regulator, mexJK operon transcriptional repressor
MPPSVSERKREDIARAALALFSRDGYERTSVDAIAAQAGVSKRTVYSHYGDKETLFLTVMQDTYEDIRNRFAATIEHLASDVDDGADLEKAMVRSIRQTVREAQQSPERAQLLQLAIAELPHFPRLLDLWRNRAIMPILAAQVRHLVTAGLLKADDPEEAADHLSALTFGQINNRSLMGIVQLSDTEIDRIITSGIRVFLCAYGSPGT